MMTHFARARTQLLGSGAALTLAFGLAGAARAQSADASVSQDPAAMSAAPGAAAAPLGNAPVDSPAVPSGSPVPANAQPAAAGTPAGAGAASSPPNQETPTGDGEIVVTGFRRSLESAITQKKSVDLVVESVSAEDIGKLPDASIAESIARLPGLTSQRSAGRDTTISIRGFSPDFSTTLLNGREQTSTGDNRAVEYDQYPAEVINQVVVYKTGQPNIIGQGLSGTVDLRTIRPLEFGKRVISIGARGSYDDKGKLNPDADKFGYRANAVFVDQFADDKIGVALAASYSHEAYEYEEFNAWGYFNPDASGNQAISGEKSYNTSSRLKRLGLTGTLEFKPTDNFTTTFDGFYSDFKDDQTHRGIEAGFSYFGAVFDPTNATARDGVYTSGAYDNVQAVVRNNVFQRHAKLYSFGLNNAYKGDDGWSAFLDISYSKTKRNERDLESYSGTGYNWVGNDPTNMDQTDTWGFQSGGHGTSFTDQLDYSDPGLIKLTDPLGWGGGTVQAGYNNNRIINDRIWQYHGEVQKAIESGFLSSVQVGLNYTNHDKSLVPDESFVTLANDDGSHELTLPEQYILKSTDLKYLGLGPILTYNPLDLIKGGVYTLIPNIAPDVFAKAFRIREDLMTIYAMGNIKAELGGDLKLTGNFGLQAVNTSQHSDGSYISGTSLQPYTDGADYWDIMPAVNLALRLPSDFVIRAAASREVMRPRMDDMRASLELGTAVDTATGEIVPTGSRGDPRLRPYRANAFDLTFEKYFGVKGYLAAQFFYKQLKNYIIENQQVPFDFTGITFTGTTQPTTTAGFVTEPININGGKIYGVELAGTIPLGSFVPALDGFGITGSGSYTKSKADIPGMGSSDLPGYSKWVGSGTAYFEKWGFSARGSLRYRSSFIGEVVGFGDSRQLRRAFGETIIDAQVGYEFAKGSFLQGLALYVQGQNLTDERFATHLPGNRLEIIDYQTFGRRFLAGFTYKF